MAANQTIEIRLIVKDEVSKAVQNIYDNIRKRDQQLESGRAKAGMEGLHKATQSVHRELSTLAKLSFGGLIGGGVVAGIVAAGNALSDMATKGLQLHYTAQSLGVSTEMLDKYTGALEAAGVDHAEAARGIEGAMGALRDLEVHGSKSELWQNLAKGARGTGVKWRNDLLAQLQGPEGLEGALKYVLRRLPNLKPEGQRAIEQWFHLPPGAAANLLEIIPKLHKRVELSVPQMRELALANANLGRSWDNIKVTLAQAFIPLFAKLTHALDDFLRSPNGQKFIEQLKQWGDDLSKAVDEWLKKGGLNKASGDLASSVATLSSIFQAADKVIKDLGLSWTEVIVGLVGLRFAGWLAGVFLNLSKIAAIPNILPLLAGLAAAAAAAELLKKRRDELYGPEAEGDPFPGRKPYTIEDIQSRLKGGTVWDRLRERGKGDIWQGILESIRESLRGIGASSFDERFQGGQAPFSERFGAWPQQQRYDDEGQSKTTTERRADLLEKRRADRELTEDFRDLHYAVAKLNDYIQPGGPEGGKGDSGYQNSVFADQPLTPIPKVSPWAGQRGLQNLSGVIEGLGRGSWFGNYQGKYNWVDKADKPGSNALGIPEEFQGIALGNRGTLGDWFWATTPEGKRYPVQQTDTGPNIRLNRLVDFTGPIAERMGFSPDKGPRPFPTDAPFKIEAMNVPGALPPVERSIAKGGALFGGVGSGNVRREYQGGGWSPPTFDEAGFADVGKYLTDTKEKADTFNDRFGAADVTTALANERSGGTINGSASVDIDVSKLGVSSRDPDELFPPTPLEGPAQMQTPAHVPYDPQSFQ